MKRFTVVLLLALCIMVLVVVPTANAKKPPQAGVIPPTASPYGMTYAQWAERWWQWFFAIPVGVHPFLDATGEFAAVGQQGPVWFLCGTGVASPTDRDVTIPTGKALFIPICNYEASVADTPNDPPFTFEQIVAMVKAGIDAVDIASVTIDGRTLDVVGSDYRTWMDDATYYIVSDDNFYGGLLPIGPVSPVAEDGYYVMLAPLSAGHHTITIDYGTTGVWECVVNYSLTVQ